MCSLVYKLSVSYRTFPSTSKTHPPPPPRLLTSDPKPHPHSFYPGSNCLLMHPRPPGNTSDQTCQFHFQSQKKKKTKLKKKNPTTQVNQKPVYSPPDVFEVYTLFRGNGGENQTKLRKKTLTIKHLRTFL